MAIADYQSLPLLGLAAEGEKRVADARTAWPTTLG
jgi:hypothetical protein